MQEYLLMIVSAVFINNIILLQFLGLCPFVGVSNKMDSAIGMSAAAMFVNVLASSICWIVQQYLLVPLDLVYLQTLAFILVIATLVQLVEIVLQKIAPPLYRSLGIYLPLITTNCMIFGVAVLNIREEHTFIQTVIYAVSTALGFSLVIQPLLSVITTASPIDSKVIASFFCSEIFPAIIIFSSYLGPQYLKIIFVSN